MAGPIRIAILANASQAKREFSETASTADKLSASVAKFRLPATLALGAFAAGSKAAVSAASDLNEEISKSQQVFGDQAGAIEKFAAGAATSLGQSKQAALDATSNFGLIAQKAGLAGGESAKFATQFTTLASDLASFNNTTPEAAIEAIGAALRGEAEPIRKYGVLLDDATLRQRALKLGLIETTSQALTPQQKALAASQEILAQTGKAQGDFARTSDGAANKSRIVAAQTANLSASLGQQLLPAYQKVLELASRFVTLMQENQTTTKVVAVAVAALAVAILAISVSSTIASAAVTAYNAVMIIFGTVQKAAAAAALGTRIGLAALAVQTIATSAVTKAATIAQAALNAVLLANPVTLLVVAIAALVAGLVIAYQRSETFRAVVDKVFSAIKTAITTAVSFVVDFVKNNWQKLVVLITGPIGAIVLLVVKNWDTIKNATKAAWEFVKNAVSTVVNALKTVVTTVFNAYVTVITGAWNKIKSATSAVWDAVKSVVSKAWDGIRTLVSTGVDKVVEFVRSLPGRITSAVSGAFDGLKEAFRSAINFIIDGWNNLSFTLPAIKIAGKEVFGGTTIGTPNIPRLATGGITTGPTLAVVGDNPGGREAVIPLDRYDLTGGAQLVPLLEAMLKEMQEQRRDYRVGTQTLTDATIRSNVEAGVRFGKEVNGAVSNGRRRAVR